MAVMTYASPNKYILVVTEREMNDAGANVFGCNINEAKSKKHATAYMQKMIKYRQSIERNNKNWVDIYIKSRGKYKFIVTGDCVEGFNQNKYIFSPETVNQIKGWLSKKVYRTQCCFEDKRGNSVLYAQFTSWEDASEFALVLARLGPECYVDQQTRYSA